MNGWMTCVILSILLFFNHQFITPRSRLRWRPPACSNCLRQWGWRLFQRSRWQYKGRDPLVVPINSGPGCQCLSKNDMALVVAKIYLRPFLSSLTMLAAMFDKFLMTSTQSFVTSALYRSRSPGEPRCLAVASIPPAAMMAGLYCGQAERTW